MLTISFDSLVSLAAILGSVFFTGFKISRSLNMYIKRGDLETLVQSYTKKKVHEDDLNEKITPQIQSISRALIKENNELIKRDIQIGITPIMLRIESLHMHFDEKFKSLNEKLQNINNKRR